MDASFQNLGNQAISADFAWRLIADALNELRTGSVVITVQDGKLVQVDRVDGDRKASRRG